MAVLALGALVTALAFEMPASGGYARVGPGLVPRGVGLGLIALGGWLLAQALRGGWQAMPEEDPAARGEHAFVAPAFVWVALGLGAQMLLIQRAGFPLAAAVLFLCVARGFGSKRPVRDAAVGLVLGVGVFLFFVRLLNVGLPAGWLQPLLGTAGL